MPATPLPFKDVHSSAFAYLESLRNILINTCTLSIATDGSACICRRFVSTISRTTPMRKVPHGVDSPKADLKTSGIIASSFFIMNKYDEDQHCRNQRTSLAISGLRDSSMPFFITLQTNSAKFNILVMSKMEPQTKKEVYCYTYLYVCICK